MGCLSSSGIGTKIENAVTTKSDSDKYRVVMIVGGPGCDTATLASQIAEEYKYNSLAISELLKKYTSAKSAGDWEEILNDMNSGKLVSTANVLKVLKVSILASSEKKILLQGYPKSQSNYDEWVSTMGGLCTLKAVVYIELQDDVLKSNLSAKGYADDTITTKMDTFTNDTKPILEKLKTDGLLITLDGSKSADDLKTDAFAAFQEKKLYQ